MANESSFDIVSTVDMQEVDNAFQQARKELAQRYDLKDSGAEISLDKSAGTLTVTAPADFVASQVIEGDKLRVSSPSRDTLQEVIAFLRGQDYGQPLQYVNYR